VVSHGQLSELGLSKRAVRHRVTIGRLHSVTQAVYAVGRPELTRHGRWMAAVLATGPGAALSHRSAAELWGFCSVRGDVIEISAAASCRHRRPGIRVHRRTGIATLDFDRHQNIPLTTPILTLVDIAGLGGRGARTWLSDADVERAVNEADRLDLVDPETLRTELERYRGRRGVARLRELLDRRTFRLTDSELERFFLPLAAQAGLPVPLTREHLNGFRVDFFWPDLGLVVETDGLRHHRTPAQQARDRLRDQEHLAAGLTPLRFTHAQVRYEPEHVRSTLREVAQRLIH
jgi:very-short-patch-repair endonuclease